MRAGQKTGMSFYVKRTQRKLGKSHKTSIHFVRPVIHRLLVVDLLPQPPYEGARRPDRALLALFPKHVVHYRHEPVLELAVVVVWDYEVTDAVHAASTQVGTVKIEVSEVSLA